MKFVQAIADIELRNKVVLINVGQILYYRESPKNIDWTDVFFADSAEPLTIKTMVGDFSHLLSSECGVEFQNAPPEE